MFLGIRTEYGKILRNSPYSVQMREQKNSEYGHFTNVKKRIDFNTHAVGFLGVISTAAPGDGPFISKRSTHNNRSP